MKNIFLGLLSTIIILLLLAFIIKKIFKKLNIFKNNKALKWFVVMLSSIAVYGVIIYIIFSFLLKNKQIEFDKNLWANKKEFRYQMIDNLIDSNILIGKNENKIKTILGAPNIIVNDQIWIYEITGRTWAEFEFIILELQFDNNQILSNVVTYKKDELN